MKSSKIKVFALFFLAGMASVLLLGDIVSAQIPPTLPQIPQVGPTTVGGAVDLVRYIVRWIYIIFFIIAVLFILFAAFTYLTAGGNEETVGKARNMIIYAAVAIIVALLAVGFEAIVRNFLSTPTA